MGSIDSVQPKQRSSRLRLTAWDGTEVDDEVLMARSLSGHLEAFEDLYERYEAPLYGFRLRMLGDETQAEDALQREGA